MNYPLISEYVEAIKLAEDNLDQLSHLRPVLDENGIPVMSSGNFAVVFKMRDGQDGKFCALKCFIKDQPGRNEAYKLIADELEPIISDYLTSIKFLPKELFVNSSNSDETEFPVLLMDWIEGVTLDKYIRDNLNDQYTLELISYHFCQMATWLLEQPFAHGDLKPDNILVKDDGSLIMVDYDGMYVPAMKGQQARELGSPDYRHPLRTIDDFDEHIDDFSLATIAMQLYAIVLQPNLLKKSARDVLLLCEDDYRDIKKSKLITELFSLIGNTEFANLLGGFLLAYSEGSHSNHAFQLFNVEKPVRPYKRKVPITPPTRVTQKDIANSVTDAFGALYSPDWKRLLKVPYEIEAYRIKPGTLTICDEAFYECHYLTAILIPDTVINIGNRAFSRCSWLTSIEIPHSVTNIGDMAFWRCSKLRFIKMSKSITSIGNNIFLGCTNLRSIIIPKGTVQEFQMSLSNHSHKLEELHDNICIPFTTVLENDLNIGTSDEFGALYSADGTRILRGPRSHIESYQIKQGTTVICDSAFCNNEFLTSIVIPDSVTFIGDEAFSFCNKLAKVHLPESITFIGDRAFADSNSLQDITIPKSVVSIGELAFLGCKMRSLTIPDTVTFIGHGAFSSCNCLTRIEVEKNNQRYDSRDNCNAIIETISNDLIAGCKFTQIPNSVTSIGSSAFGGCTRLTNIVIPNSIKSIGYGAFGSCSGLTSIDIPNSVTAIGDSAFFDCSNLSDIHIPNSVTSIGAFAFQGTPWYNDQYNKQPKGLLYAGLVAYTYFGWIKDNTDLILKDGTLGIAGNAFQVCSGLTRIEIPKSVTSIGDGAFRVCRKLRYANIPETVTTIGNKAFEECYALSEIEIPNTVTKIGDFAFHSCVTLRDIIIPNSIESIGEGAFSGCQNLKSIIVKEDNHFYDSRNNCNAIIETATNTLIAGCVHTIIPDSVTIIDDWAFSFSFYRFNAHLIMDLIDIKTIHIPNSVTSIGFAAFEHCNSLTSIDIPDSVTFIGGMAFHGCSCLVSIRIPNTITAIKDFTFADCSNLTTVNIPNSVTSVGEFAFSGCGGLESVYIPNSVSAIGNDAFNNCDRLKQIIIPKGSRDKFLQLLGPKLGNKLVEE